jgi:DNA-binding response OmpR family regulator|nr:response regulator transcription factor [Curvibacter lanceolatus]
MMPQTPTTPAVTSIAVVEDDEDIRNNVCRFLNKSGFRAWGAASAEDFYVALLRDHADLVLVDLGLPGEDGLSLVKRLAEKGIAVVVLTARGDLSSRITGLESGALQYFVKPTDLNELVAGIRSLLRRVGRSPGAEVVQASWRLQIAEAVLVSPNNKQIALTTRELQLLGCLARTPGAVVSKSALIESIGGGDADEAFHRVESQLNRLRRKTLTETGLPLPVRAIFGRGLVFVP